MKNLWRLAVAYALYIWTCSYIYDRLDGLWNVEFGFFSASGGLVLPFLFVAWLDWRAKVTPRAPSAAFASLEGKLDPKLEVLDETRYKEWSVEDWEVYYSREPKFLAYEASLREKAL